MTGLLPIYTKGSLKNFQLIGNFQNWKVDLIFSDADYILPFMSPFFNTTIQNIVSYQLKKINDLMLSQCKTNSDILNIVINSISLNTNHIYKQTVNSVSKQRYYGSGNDQHGLTIESGIYYLYFSDGTNEFESEIFKIN